MSAPNEHFYACIMAGGGGTRLWPLSRKDTPKQLLPLVDNDTMFKISVDRLAPVFPPERIYIATRAEFLEQLQREAPSIPTENFIVEPHPRNSGPAAGLAMAILSHRDPDAVVALLTADHHISRVDAFCSVLTTAYETALDDFIVTIGISPSFPATGFGYIRQGEALDSPGDFAAYRATAFTEKPSVVAATRFLASGEYTWNSGMFILSAKHGLREIQRQQGVMYDGLVALQQTIGTPDYAAKLEAIWPQMPSQSIDYAIMESAERVAVIPADIGWSDVGSWATLYDILKHDRFGNAFKGDSNDHVILDTINTLVVTNKLAATIGVSDLVIVETDDALLICHRDRCQDVRDIVEHLRALKKDDYL